jgi:hypothetical protein
MLKRAIRSVTHLVLTPARESVSNPHCDADPEKRLCQSAFIQLPIACGFKSAQGWLSAALSNPVVTRGLVESLRDALAFPVMKICCGRTSRSNQSL